MYDNEDEDWQEKDLYCVLPAVCYFIHAVKTAAKNAEENENRLLALRILLVSRLTLARFTLTGVYSSYSSMSAQITIGFFLMSSTDSKAVCISAGLLYINVVTLSYKSLQKII